MGISDRDYMRAAHSYNCPCSQCRPRRKKKKSLQADSGPKKTSKPKRKPKSKQKAQATASQASLKNKHKITPSSALEEFVSWWHESRVVAFFSPARWLLFSLGAGLFYLAMWHHPEMVEQSPIWEGVAESIRIELILFGIVLFFIGIFEEHNKGRITSAFMLSLFLAVGSGAWRGVVYLENSEWFASKFDSLSTELVELREDTINWFAKEDQVTKKDAKPTKPNDSIIPANVGEHNNPSRLYAKTMAAQSAESLIVQSAQIEKAYPVWIEKGKTVKFSISGRWSMWTGKWDSVDFRGHTDFKLINKHHLGTLMGRVEGGTNFAVKDNMNYSSPVTGRLILFPNRGDYRHLRASGRMTVALKGVKRISEKDAEKRHGWDIKKLNTGEDTDYLTGSEKEVLLLMNKARTKPSIAGICQHMERMFDDMEKHPEDSRNN
jgi:hypothetical protein